MLNLFIKEETASILHTLKHDYKDWRVSAYVAEHKNGLKLWIRNGAFYIDTYPNTHSFNLVEKILLNKAIHKANILKGLET